MRRPRGAPSASRTAISFCRVVARVSRRVATLAQAMSSTTPTIAISMIRGVEKSSRAFESPRAAEWSTSVFSRKRVLNESVASVKVSWSSASLICRYSTSSSALAAVAVSPGFSRPTTFTKRERRLMRSSSVGASCAFIISGTNTSAAVVLMTPAKPGGATPTMVMGVLLMVTG